MKVRQGFVSNSSSSSFIIPVIMTYHEVEDLQRDMYGDEKQIPYLYNWNEENFMLDTYALAEMVFYDIRNTKEQNIQDLIDQYQHNHDYYVEEIHELKHIQKSYPGRKVIEINYGDGDGKYQTHLEHSGIIEETFHGAVRISQH